ncbi:MAG: hypothetical protein Terrestrivirus1_333 [Terrestrivirus sp.]|uniref:Uncharacterized protein n=1 Tax=Terrestrivirus sp. TaxID=2487775 RepID=A0A3G4ZPT5_9VIRU|nr:MAG: hypothetical protein Terrestrivirus1_333 [Terrestrivirus sp.]
MRVSILLINVFISYKNIKVDLKQFEQYDELEDEYLDMGTTIANKLVRKKYKKYY